MSDVSAAQLRRILAVIPELADGEEHPLAEVAERAGVERDTLIEDLVSISQRYDPGGFVEGVQIYLGAESVSVLSNHFLRPLRLTVAELCALELGLAMLRTERPPEEHRSIDRARERLRKVIAKLPADEINDASRHAAVGAAGEPRHLSTVREAMRARRKVSLTYRRGAGAEASARTICPYGVVAASGMWYVVAHCERSEGVRVFRLDRIEGVEVLAGSYRMPASFSIDSVVSEGRVFIGEAPRRMTVRYSPRIARWIAERAGGTPAADGSLTLEHLMADEDWAVRHVLQYGPDAEVLEPGELRAEVARRLSAVV